MHDVQSEPAPKYVVRLRRSSAKAKTKLFDVVYNTKSLGGENSVFGHVVKEMTSMLRLEGSALDAYKRTKPAEFCAGCQQNGWPSRLLMNVSPGAGTPRPYFQIIRSILLSTPLAKWNIWIPSHHEGNMTFLISSSRLHSHAKVSSW